MTNRRILEMLDMATYHDPSQCTDSDGNEVYLISKTAYEEIAKELQKTVIVIDKKEEVRKVKDKLITVYLVKYQRGISEPYEQLVNTYDYFTTVVGSNTTR